MKTNVTPGATPPEISVMQIDQDLKDGISKSEMAIKYGIKPWEVDEIFKHPFLKGRRPSRKKALSFTFIDDTVESTECKTTHITDPEEFTDPNQVTLEDAIDEAIDACEDAKDELKQAEEDILEILSPAEPKTTKQFVEDLAEMNANIPIVESIEDKEDFEEITIEDEDDDSFEL